MEKVPGGAGKPDAPAPKVRSWCNSMRTWWLGNMVSLESWVISDKTRNTVRGNLGRDGAESGRGKSHLTLFYSGAVERGSRRLGPA